MTLDRIVVKETKFQPIMDWKLVEQFADGIPTFNENDPDKPEWTATPTTPIDLSHDGYGLVYIKNEADKRSNPTQTIKDRAAWELTTLYRDFARGLYLKKKEGVLNGNIGSVPIPRLSIITAGNVGRAISHMYQKFGLPPMKLLLDVQIPEDRLQVLKGLHADIYLTDLRENVFEKDKQKRNRPYTPQEIKILTNNKDGIDITSVMALEPQTTFYDWHVHEAFNENPDEIYVPYGSGRLWENYLSWQEKAIRTDATGRKDPRLRVPIAKVIAMSILGAEPQNQDSKADKLTKSYNPFMLFDDQDISALKILSFTGKDTDVHKVSEEKIKQAYQIMSKYVETEPSAAAGLALYFQRFEEGKINPKRKSLVVNTGKGI